MKPSSLFADAEEIADKAHLEAALASGKKLRVKFGIDPTAPDLHLGHTVPLRKLRAFQDAGHQAVLIIGDFTAMIGDPTGKSVTRPTLTKDEVAANLETYLAQAGRVVDISKAEIRRNSEWLGESLPRLIELMSKVTVQQVLHRGDFKKRIAEDADISMLEILYPLMQGYDSVAVKADVELGGTDQTFNMLMGRRVQRAFGMDEQDVMMLPLIEGTDGEKKMSKSLGNYIALNDAPDDMFGKIMSAPDALMPKYFALLTDVAMPEGASPRDAKALLARTLTTMYHGAGAGERAEADFIRKFSKGGLPTDMPDLYLTEAEVPIIALLMLAEVKSKAEARRLVEQGGVKIAGAAQANPDATIAITDGDVLQIGKLKAFRLKIK